MLLITLNEWIGPARESIGYQQVEPRERQIAFATKLGLQEAIQRILTYKVAFNLAHAPLVAINFRLLQVSIIEVVATADLLKLEVALVEDLARTAQEVRK